MFEKGGTWYFKKTDSDRIGDRLSLFHIAAGMIGASAPVIFLMGML